MNQIEDRTYTILERLEKPAAVLDPPEVHSVPNETCCPDEDADLLKNTLIFSSIAVLFGIYWVVLTRIF